MTTQTTNPPRSHKHWFLAYRLSKLASMGNLCSQSLPIPPIPILLCFWSLMTSSRVWREERSQHLRQRKWGQSVTETMAQCPQAASGNLIFYAVKTAVSRERYAKVHKKHHAMHPLFLKTFVSSRPNCIYSMYQGPVYRYLPKVSLFLSACGPYLNRTCVVSAEWALHFSRCVREVSVLPTASAALVAH